jgi:hypothetical protein
MPMANATQKGRATDEVVGDSVNGVDLLAQAVGRLAVKMIKQIPSFEPGDHVRLDFSFEFRRADEEGRADRIIGKCERTHSERDAIVLARPDE